MAKYPYVQSPDRLKSLLEKIQQVGKPEIADKKWLASLGFTGSNDAAMLRILRLLGFTDRQGRTSERWQVYRDKSQARFVLGDAIRQGYSDLFETYPDAHARSEEDLKNYFRTNSSAGEAAITKTLTTFKAVCSLAEFKNVVPTPVGSDDAQAEAPAVPKRFIGLSNLTINVNVQLTLPATTDESIYDKLFEALKKHLVVQNNA